MKKFKTIAQLLIAREQSAHTYTKIIKECQGCELLWSVVDPINNVKMLHIVILNTVLWNFTVFPSIPSYPGLPCPGEDKSIYRRGARRWRKIYRVNGHMFQAKRFNRKAFCTYCMDRIWGLGRQVSDRLSEIPAVNLQFTHFTNKIASRLNLG